MSLAEKIQVLEKQLEQLKSLESDKIFKCKVCGQEFEKPWYHEDDICSSCKRKLEREKTLKEFIEKLLGATITKIEADDYLNEVTVSKGERTFTLSAEEYHIEVQSENDKIEA